MIRDHVNDFENEVVSALDNPSLVIQNRNISRANNSAHISQPAIYEQQSNPTAHRNPILGSKTVSYVSTVREYRDENPISNVAPAPAAIALLNGDTPRSADKYQQMTLRDTPMANDEGKEFEETPRHFHENKKMSMREEDNPARNYNSEEFRAENMRTAH